MTPKQFREARIALGLTPTQMADALGVSVTHVYRMQSEEWFHCHRAVSRTMQKLVFALLHEHTVRQFRESITSSLLKPAHTGRAA